MEITTKGAQETKKLAQKFAVKLKVGELVFLIGDLGSGKTTFAQGLAKGLKIKRNIKSPTFTIIREYSLHSRGGISATSGVEVAKLIHIDLYRLEKQTEIETLGLADYFNDQNIVVVEWPENCKNWQKRPDYIINFKHLNENECKIEIKKQ